MFLVINREELKRALNITQKALPQLVIQEERSHVLVRVKGSEAIFTATNNDFKAMYKVTLEETSKEDFAFTMEPKSIGKLIAKTKIETIRIEVDLDKSISKYYTSEKGDSFMEAHTFNEEVMLTFEVKDQLSSEGTQMVIADIVGCLDFTKDFLESIKVDKARYDFIIFDKGMAYAANGSNRMCFRIDKISKGIENFRIRKVFLPMLMRVFDSLKGTEHTDVTLFDTGKDSGIRTNDCKMIFTSLVSNEASPEIKKEYVTTEGAYCIVDRRALIGKIDRLGCLEKTPNSFGIEMVLKGSGDESFIELNLVSSLDGKEVIPCKRVDKCTEDIKHVVDNKLLKGILSSFSKNNVRLYINDQESKLFKLYETLTDPETKKPIHHSFAMGSYSKILKRR